MRWRWFKKLLLLCVLISTPAHAAWYISPYAGIAAPQSGTTQATDKPIIDSLHGNISFDTAPLYGIKAGWWSSKGLGIQIDLSRYNTAQNTKAVLSGNPTPGTAVSYTSIQTVTAYTVNGLYRFFDGNVRPYVGIGAGLFDINIHSGQAEFAAPDGSLSYPVIPALITNRFGWQILGGLEAKVRDGVGVFAEFKHTDIDALGIRSGHNTNQVYAGLTFYVD